MTTRNVFKSVSTVAALGVLSVMGMTASAPASAGGLNAVAWLGQIEVTAPVTRFVAKQARAVVANLGHMTVTATRLPMVADVGSMTVTAPRIVEVADVGSMTVSAPRLVEVADVGSMTVTASRPVDVAEVGSMTVTAPRLSTVALVTRSSGGDDAPRTRTPRAVLVQ